MIIAAMRDQKSKLPAGEWIHDRYEAGRLSPLSDDKTKLLQASKRRASELQLNQAPRQDWQLSSAIRSAHRRDMGVDASHLPAIPEQDTKELVLHRAPPPEHRLTPAERGVLETDSYRPSYANAFSTKHKSKECERGGEGGRIESSNSKRLHPTPHGDRLRDRENDRTKSSSRKPLVYLSQDLLILKKVRDKGVSAMEYGLVRERMVREVKETYSYANYNDYWRLWRSEYKLWHHYLGVESFPGEEPQHKPQNDSIEPLLHVSRRSALESHKGTAASASQSRRINPRQDMPEAKGYTEVHPEESYTNLERTMEFKAIARGGDNLRREFFQFLNKTRHDIKERHPDCARGAKAHVVDVWVWNRFFSPEPFPGIPPARGHTDSCLARSKAPVVSSSLQRYISSSRTWTNPALLTQYPSSSRQLALRQVKQPSSPVRHQNQTLAKKPIAVIHPLGPSHSMVGAIRQPPVPQQSGGSSGIKNGGSDRKIINTELLRVKTQQLLSRQSSDQSSHSSSSNNQPVKIEAKSLSSNLHYAATDTSEVERLLVEEAAKIEGSSRKVVDEEYGDVITLEEYTRRIKLRALQSVGMKRKADDEGAESEDGPGGKKMRFGHAD